MFFAKKNSLDSSFGLGWLRRLSIRWRLTLIFLAVFGVMTALGARTLFQNVRHSLLKEFDVALYNYAVDVAEGVSLDPDGDLLLAPPQLDRVKIYPFYLGTALVQIRHKSGAVLSTVGQWGELKAPWTSEIERLSRGEEATYSNLVDLSGLPTPESETYRMISFPIDTALPPNLTLQIVVPTTLLENQISTQRRIFQVGIPFILVLAAGLSYMLARRGLAPVQTMVNLTRNLGAKDLSQRVPVPLARDEIQSLAITINEMLERIEGTFKSHERFIADASHQLLTPLAIVKGQIEADVREKKPINTTSLLQEVDHLSSLVKNLLILAQMDSGLSHLDFQPIDFSELVLEVVARTDSLARKKNLRMKVDLLGANTPPVFLGEETLLGNLVYNLIENAIKYSNQAGLIQISVDWNREQYILKVKDAGPGLEKDQENLVFDRFVRGSKTSIEPGFGLGLAIAQKITSAHHAELSAENNPEGGACFVFKSKKS